MLQLCPVQEKRQREPFKFFSECRGGYASGPASFAAQRGHKRKCICKNLLLRSVGSDLYPYVVVAMRAAPKVESSLGRP